MAIGNQIPNPYSVMLSNTAGNGGGVKSILFRGATLFSHALSAYANAQAGSDLAAAMPALVGGVPRCIALTQPAEEQDPG